MKRIALIAMLGMVMAKSNDFDDLALAEDEPTELA